MRAAMMLQLIVLDSKLYTPADAASALGAGA